MSLHTKSIQRRALKKDGIRICVMRRPGEDADWDLWLPKLSPSTELLDAYKYEGLTWEEFQIRFRKEVLNKQTRLLSFIAETAQYQTVTLLCWEETADRCHRKLLVETCQQLQPDLEIVLE